jgi:UDP-2-acetamido-3-amino-2,3-dideoxy-glucuronate N-acetyltransferase
VKSLIHSTARIHPTADVSPQATIGEGTKIWHQAQVREGAVIGDNCIIGKGAYIDFGVAIGANSKIQNGVFVYHGVTVEEGVFLGPGVILTNDRTPRAINPDGTQMSDADWQVTPTLIKRGASIGARAVILPGTTLGEYAMIGAGAVVTKSVPAYGLVYGNPARLQGYVCCCGASLFQNSDTRWTCPKCHQPYLLDIRLKVLQPLADPTKELVALPASHRSPSVYYARSIGQ